MDDNLHQRMLLVNRSIETLRLQKQENVKADNPIPQHVAFPCAKSHKNVFDWPTMNKFASEID